MQTELNHTVKALFGKESLDDISRDDLLLLTRTYPYSSILHFLYSNKLQLSHDLRYPASVSKTALYFSNPHWLHHQLRTRTSVEAVAEMELAYASSHDQETESLQNIQPFIPEEESFVLPDSTVESVEDSIEHEENLTHVIEEKHPDNFADTFNANISIENTEAEISQTDNGDTYLQEESTVSTDFTNTETSESSTISDHPEPDIHLNLSEESLEEIIEEPSFENEDEVVNDFSIKSSEDAFLPAENQVHDSEETDIEELTDLSIPDEDLTVSNPIHGFMDRSIQESGKEIQSEGPLIPIEPLYAIDYFASQGIRLREEEQQDQLGKKLKSFTEWLKSMKKIHPEKAKSQLDEKTEAAIKTGAEQSNDRAEILTETMAEVLIKQGLTDQAIEVYEKLSLLNPLKSATFAAKISELKA